MSANTPDRAALAERLTDLANHLARAQKEIDETADVRETVGEIVRGLDALRVQLDAEPVLPPSVAEARDSWSDAMCDLVLAMTAGATDDRDAIPGDYEVALQGLEAARDDLLTAVRAETVAEAVRVVEAVPRYVLNLNLWQGTAPTMEPAATGAWVGQTEATNALRALGGQP